MLSGTEAGSREFLYGKIGEEGDGMTKEEAVKAAALGVPVVYLDPMTEGRTVYRRIAAVIWRYATLDGALGEKSVSVELLPDNGSRSSRIVPLERVEVANPELWQQQKKIEPEKEKPEKKRAVFRKPTVGEVSTYALEMLYEMDAQAFVDHYDACGWVVGKNKPMRDWRAAVRNWVRRQSEFGGGAAGGEQKQSSFETDAFFEAALAKSYAGDI